MPFKPRATLKNAKDLVTSLTNSRIQTENNALYQTIFNLLNIVQGIQGLIEKKLKDIVEEYDKGALTTVSVVNPVSGDGSVATPLGVKYDGTTININGSGELQTVPGSGGITQLTGDVTAGPGSGSQAATIANTAVTPGSYGSSSAVGTFTVNSQGRLTAAANVSLVYNPGFTVGSVVFITTGGGFAQDNSNFFWDDTNNRLGIGNAAPAVPLDVTGAGRITTSLTTPLVIGGSGTTSDLSLQATSGAGTTGSWIFFLVGNNGAVTAMEINDVGGVGIGTTGLITVDTALVIRKANPPDIGFVLRIRSNLSAYIQVATGTGANEAAGFTFEQTTNNSAWRMAVIGNEANAMRWSTNISGSAVHHLYMSVNGNLILGTSNLDPATGTNGIIFMDGTALASLDANSAGLYANDVSGTVNMFGINEAGEISQLTGNGKTYTPTRSAEVNLDSNVTVTEAQYALVGSTVTVSGRFTADPTTPAVLTSFEITLPIASNIGAVEDVAGVAFCGNIAGQGAEILGSVANNTAVIQWVSGDVTSQSWSYIFSYQVI